MRKSTINLKTDPGKPDTYEDTRFFQNLTFGRNARLDSSSAALLLLGR